MTVNLSALAGAGQQFFDNNGVILSGGKLYSYAAGTTTPQATYTSSSGSTAHTNPIVLNSAGRVATGEIWLTSGVAYKFALYTSADVLIATWDNISGINGTGLATNALYVAYDPAGTGAVQTNVQAKLRETVSVMDFGATGNGSTNDRAAIAAAVAACRGKNLYFPEGQYLINTDGGSITLEDITLTGEMVLDGASTVIDQGAVLRFTGTTNSPFLVRRGVTLDGLGFYYPNQGDSATPTVYPPTLDFDFSNGPVQFVYIQNNVVYNSYRFINMTSANGDVGHVWITNNTIYGILTCIEISRNVEIIKILGNSFTFGHWLPATEAGCRGFTRANGSVLVIPYTDGFEFCDNLSYGYLYGLYFPTTNVCQLINITSNLFDQVRFPINALGTGNISGVQVTGNSFVAFNSQNTALQANSVRITTSGSLVIETLTFSGNTFSTTTEDTVIVSGTAGRTLTFSANSFVNWAAYKSSGTYAALNVSGASTSIVVVGNQIVSSNNFSNGVSGSCSVLTLVGNTIGQCQSAITASYNYCVSVGNQSYSTVGAVSDTITATKLYSVGNYWDKASGGTTRTALLVRKNASQTTSGTTPLTQNFATTSFDKGSNFSVNTFTAPQAGRYAFDFAILHDASGTAGDRFSFVLTASSGQVLSVSYQMIADFNSISNSGVLELAESATVTLVITRVSGTGTLTTVNDGNYNYFCARLVE